MNTAAATITEHALGSSAITQRGERRFWGGMALAMALVAFAGFAPSYYMKSRFGAGPELTPLLHLHGAVMTAWLALLIAQTALIAARRVTWHRRLGVLGAMLAVLLIVRRRTGDTRGVPTPLLRFRVQLHEAIEEITRLHECLNAHVLV
jgi:hypothetical protein